MYVDEDTERTPGWKYYYWEYKGVPIRLEVGLRELNNSTFTVVDRITFNKETVPADKVIEVINQRMERIKDLLWERAVTKVKKSMEKSTLVLDVELKKETCEEIEDEHNVTTLGVIVDSNFLSKEYFGKVIFGKKY